MGLFDIFGNGKKKAEEEERLAAEQKEQEHQRQIEEAKQAHAGMPWPGVMKINLMKSKADGNVESVEDPITPERKEEIGALIYEPKLSPEQVNGLTLQELIFLLDAHILFNKKAALPNYEQNHRVIYNDLLRRIHEAEKVYVLYNRITGYPLLDGPFALVYLEKEHAEEAAKLYQKQFRQAVVQERPGEAAPADENGQQPIAFFDYLYYLGIENILIDNGWYKAAIRRSEISAPPTSFVVDDDAKNTPPAAPALSFAMLDFMNEATWPVKYEKRDQNIKAKMGRINQLIPTVRYVIPVQQPTEEDQKKAQATGGQNAIRLPLIRLKTKNKEGAEEDKNFLPVFTDLFEYSKGFRQAGFRPAVFEFVKLPGILGEAEGIVINPRGASIIVPKQAMIQMIFAQQQPKGQPANGQNQQAGGTSGTSGTAGDSSLNSAQNGNVFAAAAAQQKSAEHQKDETDAVPEENGKVLQFPGGNTDPDGQ